MTRKAMGPYACLVSYSVDGVPSPASADLFAPLQPTRRRSPDLSAYDRLDPPRPVRPTRYGRSRVEGHTEGMDRLRAALDRMEAQVNAKLLEALRVSAEDAMRQAKASTDEARWSVDDGAFRRGPARPYATGGTVKIDPVPPAALHRGECVMGVDLSASPDRTVMGFRWPDGSIRPFSHKRSADYW